MAKGICKDKEGICFARLKNGECSVLTDAPERIPCPFKKKRKDMTDQHIYPYRERLFNYKLKNKDMEENENC